MTTSNTELAAQARKSAEWLDSLDLRAPDKIMNAVSAATTLRQLADALESKAGPVAKVRVHKTGGNAGIAWSAAPVNDHDSLPPLPDGSPLYAAPVQPEPAPEPMFWVRLVGDDGGYEGPIHNAVFKKARHPSGEWHPLHLGKVAPEPEKDERKPGVCEWAEEDAFEMPGTYRTACGHLFAFTHGGLSENKTRFCQYCGGSVGIGSSTEGGGNG